MLQKACPVKRLRPTKKTWTTMATGNSQASITYTIRIHLPMGFLLYEPRWLDGVCCTREGLCCLKGIEFGVCWFPTGSDWVGLAQPQRDKSRLHRLLHDGQQLLAQLLQVHFLAQGGAESCHRLGSVIFAAIEAPVNDPLDTTAERLEQQGDSQRGEDDGHAAVIADDATQQRGKANDEAHVDRRQDDCQRAIHQRAIDERINVPQPIPQHGETKRERDQEQQEVLDGCVSQQI